MAHIHWGFRIPAFAAALLLSGCASYYIAEPPPTPPLIGRTALPSAVRLAEDYQRSYRSKVIELAGDERAISNGALLIGATVLGLAAGKAHSSAIQGAALGGGTLYAFGLFNNDQRRALIYVEGMKALECAVAAVSPLNSGAVERLWGQLEEAKGAQRDLSSAMADVYLTGAANFSQASKPIEAAGGAFSDAATAQAAAERVIVKAESAGFDLRRVVFAVDRSVLSALKGADPQLKDVPGLISQLGGFGGLFAPADLTKLKTLGVANVESSKAGGKALGLKPRDSTNEPQPTDAAKAAIGKLIFHTERLQAASTVLNSTAAAVVEGYTAAAIKQCNVAEVAKAAPFSVSPATLVFDEGEKSTKSILVTGATPPLKIQFLESEHTGLEVSAPDRSTSRLVVTSTAELAAKPSSFQLVVSDATSHSQIVTITINPKPAAPVDGQPKSAVRKKDPR